MTNRLDDNLIRWRAERQRRMAELEIQAQEDADRAMQMLTLALTIGAIAAGVLLGWWLS